jgi:pimeloyl-ACP methyl ester carboxylesterase
VPDVEVNGVRLAYDVHGDASGEVVLLVCGTGQPAFSWSFTQIPALTAAGYRVVTFDNRGMPPSEVPPPPYCVDDMVGDAAALIEALGIGPCLVAGTSLGAFITQELALARPDLVRGAAMLGTVGRQDVFLRAVTALSLELLETDVQSRRLDVIMTAVMAFSPRRLHEDDFMQLYLDALLGSPAWEKDGALGQYAADRDYDNRLEALGGITVPSLVVGFELDMLTATNLGREVADAIDGCGYVEIPGSGHAGIADAADEVNAVLLEFFASLR